MQTDSQFNSCIQDILTIQFVIQEGGILSNIHHPSETIHQFSYDLFKLQMVWSYKVPGDNPEVAMSS